MKNYFYFLYIILIGQMINGADRHSDTELPSSDDYSFFANKMYQGLQEEKRLFDRKVHKLVNEKKIRKQTRKELEDAVWAKRSWWQVLSPEEKQKLEIKIDKEQNRRIQDARINAINTVKQQKSDELLRAQEKRAALAKKVGVLVRQSMQKPVRFDSEIENIAYQELESQKVHTKQEAERALRAEWEEYRKNPYFEQKARESLTKKGKWWGTIKPAEADVQKEATRNAQRSFAQLQKERAERDKYAAQQRRSEFKQRLGSVARKSLKKTSPFEGDLDSFAYRELEHEKKQAQQRAIQDEKNERMRYIQDPRFQEEARKALTKEIPPLTLRYGTVWGTRIPPTEADVRIEAEKRAQEAYDMAQLGRAQRAQLSIEEARIAAQEKAEEGARGLTATEQKAAQRFKSFVSRADTEKIKGSLIEGYNELRELQQEHLQAEVAAQERLRQANVEQHSKALPMKQQPLQQEQRAKASHFQLPSLHLPRYKSFRGSDMR